MKIQVEFNGPERIVVNAAIHPIEFTTAGFHVDWESLATMREVETQKSYPVSTFQGFLPKKAVSVGEHWKIDPVSVLQLLKQFAEEPQLELWNDDGGGSGHHFAASTTITRRLCSVSIPHSPSKMGCLHHHNLPEVSLSTAAWRN